MVTLSALISDLDAELMRLGYKESTMLWYRRCWRRLERFFAAQGVEAFSLDRAMAWVDDACDFFAKEQVGTLKPTDVYLFRVAQMLGDYGTLAGEFIAFVGTRGRLVDCDTAIMEAFVTTLAGYQPKTVEQKLCAVRSFLRFAARQGWVEAGLWESLPAVKSSKQARIPSVWDPTDVVKILDAIDRGNPRGKRDYAIIVLITRLGLRGVDVKRLTLTDFDWPGNRLWVNQVKTGHRVQLPLLKDVGWAVIDYMRFGRPASDCRQVFLRHTAPIGPFPDQDHLHQILVKHARAAHVALGDQRRHGMHSLRHTLATRLMEAGTPIEQIADILGHQSTASTGVYLKSSLGLLTQCALDPDAASQGVA